MPSVCDRNDFTVDYFQASTTSAKPFETVRLSWRVTPVTSGVTNVTLRIGATPIDLQGTMDVALPCGTIGYSLDAVYEVYEDMPSLDLDRRHKPKPTKVRLQVTCSLAYLTIAVDTSACRVGFLPDITDALANVFKSSLEERSTVKSLTVAMQPQGVRLETGFTPSAFYHADVRANFTYIIRNGEVAAVVQSLTVDVTSRALVYLTLGITNLFEGKARVSREVGDGLRSGIHQTRALMDFVARADAGHRRCSLDVAWNDSEGAYRYRLRYCPEYVDAAVPIVR
jgi:hypothetical protein